jgi:hypothetical protein
MIQFLLALNKTNRSKRCRCNVHPLARLRKWKMIFPKNILGFSAPSKRTKRYETLDRPSFFVQFRVPPIAVVTTFLLTRKCGVMG